jgi:hypothetical protein
MRNTSHPTSRSSAKAVLPGGFLDNFLDSFNESLLVDWLSRNGKNVLYGLAALIALFLLIYRVSGGSATKAEADYFQAANDFSRFSHSNSNEESLKELLSLMDKHPELHAAYDAALAQFFLNRGDFSQAEPLALATLARTKSTPLPFYRHFAETTLLISNKEFRKALDRTEILQTEMMEQFKQDAEQQNAEQKEPIFGEELFALNLLRTGMLQQELGDHAGELQTWRKWKEYAGLEKGEAAKTGISPQAFRKVIQQLAIGAVSLPDYFYYREQTLKNG